MDEKLSLITGLVDEIKKTQRNSFPFHQRLLQANILADDVIQKLINLRNLCGNVSLNTSKDGYNNSILMKSNSQQHLFNCEDLHVAQMVNIKTEAVINNDDANLIEIAYNAFANENYAKCVRTVEKIATLQQNKLSV
uniref:Uncharacterized protein n=1 Tax=Setaria digitata TaxID=48799 RepID=A0A915PSI9_9BILA